MSSLQPHLGGDEIDELDFDVGVFDSFTESLAAADEVHAYPFNPIDLSGGSPNNFKATRDAIGRTIGQPSDITRGESNAAPEMDSQEFTRSFMSHVQEDVRRETASIPEASSNQNAILSPDNSLPSKRHRSKLKRSRISESIWSNKRPAIEKHFHADGLEPMMHKMRTNDFDPSPSAYKARLKAWGVRKNVPKKAAEHISRLTQRRKHEEGKESRVRLHGRTVPPTTIQRAAEIFAELQSLSISTPSGNSSRSLHVRSQPVDTRESSSSRRSGNQPVEIHQRDEFRLKSGNETLERVAPLIKEIGGQTSLSREALSDALKSFSMKNLHDLLESSLCRRSDWVVDLIHENIIMRAGDSSILQETDSWEKSEHVVVYLMTLLKQQKFWQAEMMAQGICVDRNLKASPSHYRLCIFKILLLAKIGEDVCEPRAWDEMEQRCSDIIKGERQFQPNSTQKEPFNLILAYLFRVYGFHHHILQRGTISEMKGLINNQFDARPPRLCFAWAAQQYARWCIRNGQYEDAMEILENLALRIPEMRQPEKISTDENQYYIQLCRQRLSAADEQSTMHVTHEVYPVDSDRRFFEAVEEYLWRKPLPVDPAERFKYQDSNYFH
ncbi:MAG: hypothetical protein Q9214_004483 [Letrouitia sp. 1 TL-2023]